MTIDLLLRWMFHRSAELNNLRWLLLNSVDNVSSAVAVKRCRKALLILLNNISDSIFII